MSITIGSKVVNFYQYECDICGITEKDPKRFVHGAKYEFPYAQFPRKLEKEQENEYVIQVCNMCALNIAAAVDRGQEGKDNLGLENKG